MRALKQHGVPVLTRHHCVNRVQDYDRTKRLVGWQASLLRNVRKGIMEEPDLS